MTDAPSPHTQDAARSGHHAWTWRHLPRGARAEPVARDWLSTQFAIAPDAVPLQRDARNRPRLHDPLQHWDANWSHSGGGLLVACGRDVDVGVDVEWTGRARPRALEIAQRYFHSDEAAWLASLPATQREVAFLRLWCAKEAVLKALGVGLVFGLHRLRFDGDGHLLECDADLGTPRDWHVESFTPAHGYVAALAWRARAS